MDSCIKKRKLQEKNDEEDVCDGLVKLPNPHLSSMEDDVLYHIALGTNSHDLPSMFSDVKFVCVGGSAKRMHTIAEELAEALNIKIPTGMALTNIAQGKGRYAMYKIGPVLTVSVSTRGCYQVHGMGVPSMSILFHELFKLLQHARCKNPTVFRVGTSGGLGYPGGTVVITEEALDPFLVPKYEIACLGKIISRPAVLDQDLAKDILACAEPTDEFQTVMGKTLCTHDFYEGQGRLDGAFCEYTENDKMEFLQRLYSNGVRNIEMEAIAFAAMCHHAQIKGAVVCVTLLDRMKGDQVSTPSEIMAEWQKRPIRLLARYIKKQLQQ